VGGWGWGYGYGYGGLWEALFKCLKGCAGVDGWMGWGWELGEGELGEEELRGCAADECVREG